MCTLSGHCLTTLRPAQVPPHLLGVSLTGMCHCEDSPFNCLGSLSSNTIVTVSLLVDFKLRAWLSHGCGLIACTVQVGTRSKGTCSVTSGVSILVFKEIHHSIPLHGDREGPLPRAECHTLRSCRPLDPEWCFVSICIYVPPWGQTRALMQIL